MVSPRDATGARVIFSFLWTSNQNCCAGFRGHFAGSSSLYQCCVPSFCIRTGCIRHVAHRVVSFSCARDFMSLYVLKSVLVSSIDYILPFSLKTPAHIDTINKLLFFDSCGAFFRSLEDAVRRMTQIPRQKLCLSRAPIFLNASSVVSRRGSLALARWRRPPWLCSYAARRKSRSVAKSVVPSQSKPRGRRSLCTQAPAHLKVLLFGAANPWTL